MEYLIPLPFQRWWDLPSQFIISQPHPDQVSCVGIVVLVRLSAVKECKIVDEAHVTRFHRGLEAALARGEVEGVKGLGLSFGDGRDAFGSWGGGATGEEVAAEIEDNLAVLMEEEGAVLVREFLMSETRKGRYLSRRTLSSFLKYIRTK